MYRRFRYTSVGSTKDETAIAALEKMVGEDTEIISVYYGCDVTDDEAEPYDQDPFPL